MNKIEYTKRLATLFVFFAVVLSVSTFSSCIDDGEETIALEYGNVKTMSKGRWRVRTVTGSTIYYINKYLKPGYYIDVDYPKFIIYDNYNKQLINGSFTFYDFNSNNPYLGEIGDIRFEIIWLSDTRWKWREYNKPSGWTIEFEKVGEYDNENGNDQPYVKIDNKMILGKWIEKTYEFVGEGKEQINSKDKYIIFNSNNTYTVKSSILELGLEHKSDKSYYLISQNNSEFIIFNNDLSNKYLIKKLTSTELEIWGIETDKNGREYYFEKATFYKAN